MKPRSYLPTLSVVACMLIGASAHAASDSWSGNDKIGHAAVSALIGTASGGYFENRWTAFGVAMIPGLAKELVDSGSHNNRFSGKDLAADALGAALGVQLGHWIITSRGLAFQSTF